MRMRERITTVLSLLLLLGLLAGLFGGCGKNDTDFFVENPTENTTKDAFPGGDSVESGVPADEVKLIDFADYTELAENSYFSSKPLSLFKPASGESFYVQESVVVGKCAYILLMIINDMKAGDFYTEHQNKEWTAEVEMQYRELWRSELFVVDEQGDVAQRLNLGQIMPVEMNEIESISVVSSDRIYVIGSKKIEKNRETSPKMIVEIDGDGNVLGNPLVLDAEEDGNRGDFYGSVVVNEDGIVCALKRMGGESELLFYDDEGALLFSVKDKSNDYENGWMIYDVLVEKDVFYALGMYHKDNLSYLIPVDVGAQTFGERIDMSVNPMNTTVSDGVVCTSDSDSVRVYSLERQESATLLFWNNQDVAFDLQQASVLLLSGDKILVNSAEFDSGSRLTRTSFSYLSRADVNPNANKTLIQVGGVEITQDQGFMEAVQKFNEKSEDSRIRLIDYSKQLQAQGVTDYSEVDRIVEMMYLSGEIPDVLFAGGQVGVADFSFYASRGLFADLNVLMDQDDTFQREDYVDLLFDLPASGDKLFYTFYSFGIGGVRTRAANLAGKDGWTLSELETLFDSFSARDVMYPESRFGLLLHLGSACFSELVDTAEKKAYFESDYFKKILAFCKNHGLSDEEWVDYQISLPFVADTSILEGSALRNGTLQFSFSYGCASAEEWKHLWNSIGSDVALVGYPADSGSNLVCSPRNIFAIAESSENKEAAWEFVEFMLSESFREQEIPVSKSWIEQRIQEQMAPLSNSWYADLIEMTPLTEEGAEAFRELLQRPMVLSYYDPLIFNIILEESGAYFAGQKSVDATAKIIQDRVQVYLNQMG